MERSVIDTNLIIRFLVNDDPQKVFHVEDLLKNNQNKKILLDTVIAEIIWVLSSYYELEKADIIEKIQALIHIDSIECNSFLISHALSIWGEHNISYVDAYIVSVAELGNMTLYTYDKSLKSISSINAQEP